MRGIALLGRSRLVRLVILAGVLLCTAGVLAAQSSAATCPVGDDVFVAPSGSAWNVKGNWSEDVVPSGEIDACWASGTTVVMPASDHDEEGTRSITGGTLEVDGANLNLGTASSIDSLVMNGGGLSGSGLKAAALTVNGPITWSAGSISAENGLYVNQTSGNISIVRSWRAESSWR